MIETAEVTMTEKTDVTVKISPITSEQDAVVCHIIRTVGAEFGAVGEGFGPGDAEVQAMSRHSALRLQRIDPEYAIDAAASPLNNPPC